MNRDGVWVRVLCTTALALVLGIGTSAQESSPAADAPASAEQGAQPAEQLSRRERRRNAEAAAAAAAATAAAAPTDSVATAEPEVVCKSIKPIGSRVERRVCATEQQWAATNQSTSSDAQESMRQIRDRSGVTGGGGGGPASLGTPTMGQ